MAGERTQVTVVNDGEQLEASMGWSGYEKSERDSSIL